MIGLKQKTLKRLSIWKGDGKIGFRSGKLSQFGNFQKNFGKIKRAGASPVLLLYKKMDKITITLKEGKSVPFPLRLIFQELCHPIYQTPTRKFKNMKPKNAWLGKMENENGKFGINKGIPSNMTKSPPG